MNGQKHSLYLVVFVKIPTCFGFRYEISHRILAINHLLEKMNICNNNLCSFCNDMP